VKYTLKHRLIGAAVLAAIAVLFLPSFFKEKQGYSVSTKSQIPPRPNITPEEFKAPEPVADIEPAPAPETMFAPTEATSESVSSSSAVNSVAPAIRSTAAAPVQPAAVPAMPLNAQGIPDAWVVQVGSFTNKETAN
jgi:DedD protein